MNKSTSASCAKKVVLIYQTTAWFLQAAVRLGRLAKSANEQSILALEPLHDNLALSPVGCPVHDYFH